MIEIAFNEYHNIIEDALKEENIIFTHKGEISISLCDESHFFIEKLTQEVKNFCQQKDIEIDQIIFMTIYSSEFKQKGDIGMKMLSTTELQVVKHNDKNVAIIFLGSIIERN